MIFSLSPFAPENLVSLDGFGNPVPCQPAHLHTQAESGTYGIPPEFRGCVHLLSAHIIMYYECSSIYNICICPSHSYRVLSGDSLVGGNPTMNTPGLHRGGGTASSSNLVLTVSVLLFSILYSLFCFVTQLPSWSDGPYFLFGVFMPLPCFLFF